MNKRLLFLINPNAGKGEIRAKALDVIDLFVREGYEVTVHTTQRRWEIPDLLRERAGGFDRIVCSGGDGTLNETINGLLACENRPPLGYIPAGTVNDFASSLGIPKTIPEAAAIAVDGAPYACDVGLFGSRAFSYIAAFGAFTDVSYQTPQQVKNWLGRAAYILEGIKRLPGIQPWPMRLVCDGRELAGEFLFGMITNSTSVGGFAVGERIGVSMNDGLLEVVLVRQLQSHAERQRVINALLEGELDPDFVTVTKARRVEVFSDQPRPWTLDGEFGGEVEHVVIEVLPSAIQVLTDPALAAEGAGLAGPALIP